MSRFQCSKLIRAAALATLSLAGVSQARAADMPDFGSRFVGAPAVRWDGISVGATVAYSNFNANFQDSFNTDFGFPGSQATSERQIGAFIGYNTEWDGVVLGGELAYNRPSKLDNSFTQTNVSGTVTTVSTANISLTDYATARIRAGYPMGQFLLYGFFGAAVARMNYTVSQVSSTGATWSDSRSQAFAAGFTAGLGADVILLPNLFLRAEWEYTLFTKVGSIRTNMNTGRVGVGLKF